MLPTSVSWLQSLRRAVALCTLAVLASCGGGGGGGTTSVPAESPAPAPAAPASAASAPTASLQIDWPPVTADIEAKAPSVFQLHATGGDGKHTWTVRCGAHLDCSIVDNSKLQVSSRAEANPFDSPITLTVTDGQGAKTSETVNVVAWPKLLAVQSLIGAPDRPGIHMLILNDGFLPEELGLFHDAASNMLKDFFGNPEIAAHRDAWNVHVADLVVMDDTTGKPRASPLGASLGCAGIARLLCVDQGRTQRIASFFLPHYTHALLIINNTEYGGSGGAVASITRHPLAVQAATHELGHSFAGLGDEYIDAAAASTYLQIVAPNLTRSTERNNIPWQLWIDAGTPLPTQPSVADVVGLFEGGGYVSTGTYRPTFDSFMRNIGRPIGPVNGEAWARSVYGLGGAWRRVAPADNATLDRSAQPTSGWLFEAQPLLERSIAETRWYVDGVERADQRGAGQLLLSTTGAVQVRVELVDLTGRVRQNQGVVSTRKWTMQ